MSVVRSHKGHRFDGFDAIRGFYRRDGSRDVPDPDSTIRYPVKYRHPALSGIRVKFAGYFLGEYCDIFYFKHQIEKLTVVKNYENTNVFFENSQMNNLLLLY